MSNSTDNSTSMAFTSAKCIDWKLDFNVYWLYTYITCSVVSILGNSLVMALVFANQNLKVTQNFFIVNMCASDVLVPVFFLGKYLIFLRYQAASLFICKFVPYFWRISMSVSVQSLLTISVHRFYAVFFPVHARMQKSKVRCGLIISFIWLLALAMSYPELHYRKVYSHKHGTYCYNAMEHKDWVVYHVFLLITLVAVPFGTMSVMYTAIIARLHTAKQPPGNSLAAHIEKRRRQNIRLSRTLITIVAVFFLFCGVYWLLYVQTFSRKHVNISSCSMRAYFIVSTFPSMYSGINPFMYFWFWKSYRRGLKHTLKGCVYHFVWIKQKLSCIIRGIKNSLTCCYC